MDMNLEQVKPVMNWIKAHLMIAIMSVLIVAFLFCGWYFSNGMSAQLADDIADRKKNFQKIDQASKSKVSLPLTNGDFEASGVLNKQLLDSMRTLTETMSGDLESVRTATLRHNGDPFPGDTPHPDFAGRQSGAAEGSKRLLLGDENLFPNPSASEAEDLPNKVHGALIAAYAQMLKDARAGMPPAPSSLSDTLLRERSRFIELDKRKADLSELTDAELQELTKELTKSRLQIYNQAASDLSFYADASVFDLPESPFLTKTQHSLAELYDWHWDWWVAEDIIAAIEQANTPSGGTGPDPVVRAPVKRLIAVTTLDSTLGSIKAGATNANQGGRSKGRGGGSSNRGQSPTSGPLPEPVVGMDSAFKTDFSVSLTGRTSNDLVDVRTVEIVVVVETEGLPRLVNALAQENFITITNLSIAPTSAFTAAEQGFIYGERPVSMVTMELETLWFRKWTAAWMPAQVRDALGIKSASNSG